jgi:glycosyltransferase involved in cell wall biosynthesis
VSKDNGIILYDFLRVPGGAEKVTLRLANAFPRSHLCVGSIAPGARWWDYIALERIRDLKIGGEWAPWLAVRSIRDFRRKTDFLSDYQWALFSGSYAPVAVHNRAPGGNVYYCHTIPRFVYDLKRFYHSRIPAWQRPALGALIQYVKPRYEMAIKRMDTVVANSQNVAQRLKAYLDIDAEVVYPPCDTAQHHWEEPQGYYLSTARLESYKRVGLVIDAFRHMPDKKLVVASGGSEFPATIPSHLKLGSL